VMFWILWKKHTHPWVDLGRNLLEYLPNFVLIK